MINKKIVPAFIGLALLFSMLSNTGNVAPTSGTNVDRAGLTAWTDPGNILSDNTADATCNGTGSDYLVASGFGIDLPAGSIINGILVSAEVSEHSGGTEPLLAQLQDAAGALVGTGKSTSNEGNINGTGKSVYTYGGTADTWDASPTEAMVEDADFGVRLWFATSHDVRIDYITLQIEYTVPLGKRVIIISRAKSIKNEKINPSGTDDAGIN